jgi:lysophospholipase L1-like esterase
MRVPAGSGQIDLSDINPLMEVPATVNPDLLLTNAEASISEAATLGVSVAVVGGVASFDFRIPNTSAAAAWAGTSLSTTDLNSIVTAGSYRQGSKTSATEARHYPVNDRGTLFVTQITADGDVLQEYRAVGSVLGVSYYRERISGAWSEWMPIAPNRGPIPVGLSLDAMYLPQHRGTWRVTVGTQPGLPVASTGILEIVIADAGSVLQRFTTMPGARTWQRRISAAGAAEAWQKLATLDDIPTVPAPGDIPTTYPALGILHAGLALATERAVGIVFAGSSTTGGALASTDAKRYVNRLVTALRKRYTPDEIAAPWVQHSAAAAFTPITGAGVHGYNVGVGGANASSYLTTASMDNVAALNPWAIVHMIGSNDWATNRTISTYRSDVLAKLDYLEARLPKPCVHVLAHSFGRWDVAGAYNWSLYGAALKEIADSRPNRVAYVDVSGAFAALGVPSSDPLDVISTDNIHANDLGHAILADAMYRRLTSV